MATIKDIAREAGVGVGTVSRHLNGVTLKPQTARKVQDAIDRLGFTLNQVARGLKTNRTRTVGVVIPNFADIYGSTMVKYLERGLAEHGYGILVCDSSDNPVTEAEKVSQLLQRRVDALFLYPCSSNLSYLQRIPELAGPESKFPVLVADMKADGYLCDQVRTDNRDAARIAIRKLIADGHRRIGLISGPNGYFTAEERKQGYLEALEEGGISPEDSLMHMTPHFDEEGGKTALEAMLDATDPPSAVLACNYYTTLGAVQAVYDRKLCMPDELALIGFDNLGLSAMVRPALSILVQPMEEIGTEAARLLIRRMHGDREGFPVVLEMKANLLLKGST